MVCVGQVRNSDRGDNYLHSQPSPHPLFTHFRHVSKHGYLSFTLLTKAYNISKHGAKKNKQKQNKKNKTNKKKKKKKKKKKNNNKKKQQKTNKPETDMWVVKSQINLFNLVAQSHRLIRDQLYDEVTIR